MSLPVVEQPLTALGAIGGEGLRGITGAVQQMQQPLMQGAQRGMLGRALQDIAQQPQMTPLSQMAALSRVSDPQTAMAFQPFLQSERARFAAQQRLEKPSDIDTPQQNIEPSSGIFDIDNPNYLVPKTKEQLEFQALGEMENTGVTYNEALQRVQESDAKRIANEESFERRKEIASNQFDNNLNKFLQTKGGAEFADIIGEMQGRYQQQVVDDVSKGMAPREAGIKAAKDALDFAKVRKGYESKPLSKTAGLFRKDALEKEIKNIRKEYEKRGELEQFVYDTANKGFSLPFANSIAFPLSSTEKEIIEKSNLGKRLLSPDQLASTYQKISDQITPSDSLQSIALNLQLRSNLPGNNIARGFFDYINNDPNVSLNPRQLRELQETTDFLPNFKDLFYRSMLRR